MWPKAIAASYSRDQSDSTGCVQRGGSRAGGLADVSPSN
jgi:hypothetical protein